MESKAPELTAADLKRERVRQSQRIGRQIWILSSVILTVMLSLALLYGRSSSAREIERKLSWGFQFELRDKLNQSPEPDPRLRILMFDDSTVQAMKRSQINFREWSSLLTYLDRHRPASIYIDKIFGLLDDDPSVLQDALPILRSLRTPVSIASFTSPRQIAGRDELLLQSEQLNVRNYLPDSLAEVPDSELRPTLERFSLKDRSKAFQYGPMQQLQEVFNIGHIDYPHVNQIYPIYNVGKNALLPSLALSGRINLKLENNAITAGGQTIPTTSDGTVLVNWLNPVKAYSRAQSFASAFSAMRSGSLWNKIPEGSHILIIPLAFTGNVDFKDSPYGQLPGGLVLASVLNSALSKQWLSDFNYAPHAIILLVLLAGVLQFVKGMRSWIVMFAGMALIAAFGLYQFVYASTDVPWLAGEVFFGGTGTLLLSARNLWDARREKLLQKLEEDYERLEREEKRLQKEMRDAARIAMALKPEDVPQWPDLEISAFHKSMSEASGDWFFFERSVSGRFAHFVLCDISGHGVQAALVVSGCKTVLSMLRLEQNEVFDSSEFLLHYANQLNKVLFLNGNGNHTATMVGLTFDLMASKVYCVDCGHPFPVIHTTIGDKIESLTTFSSDPIGFNETAEVTLNERTLVLGDCLIAHSDGVPVTRGRRVLQKFFREIEHGPIIPAKRLVEGLFKHFKKEKMDIIEDDVSLVVFRKVS
ncbi:MAG: hypothetical protein RLZZ488_1807 [Pseudomonadota bacterium]